MYTSENLMYLEYRAALGAAGPADWARHPRHPLAIHPVHARQLAKDLKKTFPSQEFRLIEVKDEDIPF